MEDPSSGHVEPLAARRPVPKRQQGRRPRRADELQSAGQRPRPEAQRRPDSNALNRCGRGVAQKWRRLDSTQTVVSPGRSTGRLGPTTDPGSPRAEHHNRRGCGAEPPQSGRRDANVHMIDSRRSHQGPRRMEAMTLRQATLAMHQLAIPLRIRPDVAWTATAGRPRAVRRAARGGSRAGHRSPRRATSRPRTRGRRCTGARQAPRKRRRPPQRRRAPTHRRSGHQRRHRPVTRSRTR